ncbi:hypothetical protein PpBr36_00100 [Pyricularia pennisetigena]|uniref:hypothetical protein n=1 Tax=Pyricularia pennisetigena TaxID=1578925 RepID=UPI0011515C42|nr:hypothetical protein PpBr36_00100 [Pyricularia pennisetigena]TLS29182.1 hypothetical protein PpBr36_00100 [Pyricularia pennisetigena]
MMFQVCCSLVRSSPSDGQKPHPPLLQIDSILEVEDMISAMGQPPRESIPHLAQLELAAPTSGVLFHSASRTTGADLRHIAES